MPDPPPIDARDWGLVVLVCLCAALSGTLEVLFIPLYVGSAIVPVVVLFAVVGNVALPRWGYSLVHSIGGAALPFLSWLLPVLVLALYPRAEGDVLVLGSGGQQWTFYGVVLLGCAVGFRTTLHVSAPPPRPATTPRPGGRISR